MNEALDLMQALVSTNPLYELKMWKWYDDDILYLTKRV